MTKRGKWICFNGDFDLYLAEKVSVRRYQRDQLISPSWRVDSPWHNVCFYREFELKKPTRLRFYWEGQISIYFYDLDWYVYEFTGELNLAAGSYRMQVWVYNPCGIPCLRVDGEDFCSDGNFVAGYNHIDKMPCSEIECGDMTPNTYRLPVREVQAAGMKELHGKVYDLGVLRMCFVRFRAERGTKFRCYFGEILSEALSDEHCEQVDFFTAGEGEYETPVSKAFRYLRVCADGDYTLSFWEEYDPRPQRLALDSPDSRLNKIVEVAKYTFSVCSREFHLDGAKRDRWLWGGDLYQAFRMEYYVGADFGKIRSGITAILGKEPVCRYLNNIMDYTQFVLVGIWEYYLHSADEKFLHRIYPIMRAHMEFVLGRTNRCGFLYNKPHDWVFVDWGEVDTEGELSFEQILLWKALRACGKVAEMTGNAADAARYLSRSEKLKRKIEDVFWDEERGIYRHSRKRGKVGDCVTAYANVFAVLYGFAEEEKRARIGQALLTDASIPQLTTPYMQCYRLSCLAELGRLDAVDAEIHAYWGGMLDQGATTFWETYYPGETEEESAPMYGRPFGRSHCHIWGSGVLYLIPRYYYGIRYDFGAEDRFVMKPVLQMIDGNDFTCALRRGSLHVSCRNGNLEVFADGMDGTLCLDGVTYVIRKGEKLKITGLKANRIPQACLA